MNGYIVTGMLLAAFCMAGCGHKSAVGPADGEDSEAKAMLQGIWLDEISENVVFKAEGDTIFYPDSTSLPAVFRIVDDTLVMGDAPTKYQIVKQTESLFFFKNADGDLVKLVKSCNDCDTVAFVCETPKPLTVVADHKLKTDTVVMYGGERYHCYIAVNPTTYKVTKSSYTGEGVKVDNVYYDNIIHVSVYKGATQLYSRDFNKQMFSRFVPDSFLGMAVLGNMEFGKVDAKGFHFNSTICIPDGDSCYLLDTRISFDGEMTMELLEY